jgi:predicted ArsR family transcriptional regulator
MASDVWRALAVLCEPRRREVYEYVASEGRPLSRDDVSAALGMGRSLAAFHLEKLAAAGFLDYTFERPAEAGPGPAVGRRSKYYSVGQGEIELSLPPRRYDIAGGILARAVAASRNGSDPVTAARRVARADGRLFGEQFADPGRTSPRKTIAAAKRALTHFGYGPAIDHGQIRLSNCPFQTLSEAEPDVVCGLNESFVRGLLEGIQGDPAVVAARHNRERTECCVLVRTSTHEERAS